MAKDRVKADFSGADREEFNISRNHEDYGIRSTGLYLSTRRDSTNQGWGAFDIDDIPGMIEALQSVYDDFEANKPKPFVEKMEAAKSGSVVTHHSGGAWMKHENGDWVSYYGDRHDAAAFQYDGYKFVHEA